MSYGSEIDLELQAVILAQDRGSRPRKYQQEPFFVWLFGRIPALHTAAPNCFQTIKMYYALIGSDELREGHRCRDAKFSSSRIPRPK